MAVSKTIQLHQRSSFLKDTHLWLKGVREDRQSSNCLELSYPSEMHVFVGKSMATLNFQGDGNPHEWKEREDGILWVLSSPPVTCICGMTKILEQNSYGDNKETLNRFSSNDFDNLQSTLNFQNSQDGKKVLV